jgi:signal transduction histidine kinase
VPDLRRQAWLSWASIALLGLLCAILAILQYRWIGEIAGAERGRLRDELQSRLFAVRTSFNDELSKSASALIPVAAQAAAEGREAAYAGQYLRWRETHDRIFRRIALAVPAGESVELLSLDLDSARYSPSGWPAEWSMLRDSLTARLRGEPRHPSDAGSPLLFEIPRFSPAPGFRGGGREQDWLVLELEPESLRSTLFPDLLSTHLGISGKLGYDAQITAAADPSAVLYTSTSAVRSSNPDASVLLGDIHFPGPGGPGARGGRDGGRGPVPPPGAGPGRWRLNVWNKSGSLDTLVARTRARNLAISAGLLLLILAAVATLYRLSRQAQRLGEAQLNFVAGVSHEFRTPLTVIRTAAFNLQGKLAGRPDQVSRYGALIQSETDRLTALVEQVLRFAGASAGHVIRSREPHSVDALIDEGLHSSRASLEGPSLVVEKHIEPNLPFVMADSLAMRHALQNLVDNALKYGTEGSHWIGIFAAAVATDAGPAVEIRVADHGPGIPLDEQKRLFDPFFRGRRAIQDQIHGTGLGLNLVKRIVEAHGGTITVRSEPLQGTEFVIRIPAAPPEVQDELTYSFD